MTHERTESIATASPVPAILVSWLAVFRPCFTAPVWNHILVLVAGAVLAPGKRTVTQALRVMGLADEPGFGRPAFGQLGCANQTLGHYHEGKRLVSPAPSFGLTTVGSSDQAALR